MATLTLRGYARHRKAQRLPGASLQAVQKALKRGWIHAEASGRIAPERADGEWAALHVPRVSVYRSGTRQLKREAPDPPAPAYLSRPFAALYELRALLGEMTEPLFRLNGTHADCTAVITRLTKMPELLLGIEDGMMAASVPLLESDMPGGGGVAHGH